MIYDDEMNDIIANGFGAKAKPFCCVSVGGCIILFEDDVIQCTRYIFCLTPAPGSIEGIIIIDIISLLPLVFSMFMHFPNHESSTRCTLFLSE